VEETRGRAVQTISGFCLPLLILGLSLVLTGCVGYVRGDGGGVMVAEPDFFWWGGYGDGWGARGYGYRGAGSRGFGRGGGR
jgi:hypothetical protein